MIRVGVVGFGMGRVPHPFRISAAADEEGGKLQTSIGVTLQGLAGADRSAKIEEKGNK
jgi:hypothetical protein